MASLGKIMYSGSSSEPSLANHRQEDQTNGLPGFASTGGRHDRVPKTARPILSIYLATHRLNLCPMRLGSALLPARSSVP